MQRTLLTADELKNAGFEVKVNASNKSIFVSLKNRKPSKMEIETALEQRFDEIKFNVTSLSDCVLVTV